jgi:hypothetical protein
MVVAIVFAIVVAFAIPLFARFIAAALVNDASRAQYRQAEEERVRKDRACSSHVEHLLTVYKHSRSRAGIEVADLFDSSCRGRTYSGDAAHRARLCGWGTRIENVARRMRCSKCGKKQCLLRASRVGIRGDGLAANSNNRPLPRPHRCLARMDLFRHQPLVCAQSVVQAGGAHRVIR